MEKIVGMIKEVINMKEKLVNDLKQAMKDNNTIKKNIIQLIRAAVLQEEKDKQCSLTNNQIEDLIMQQKKKLLDALGQYEKANRQDLIDKTKKEIGYLSNYLPQPASEYEIEQEVKAIITEMNATMKEMGQVMRKAKEKFGNRANGKLLSDIVKNQLKEV
jgi:uncharacterized protein YqeY